MAPPASEGRRSGDRRRLVDRRSPVQRRTGQERRRGERRALSLRTARDRRAGADRRAERRRGSGERRAPMGRRIGPRRRATPTPFSVEETQRLREALTTPGTRARCPACQGVFTLGPRRVRGSDVVRKVTCLSCGRNAVVANTAAMRVLVIDGKVVLRNAIRSILLQAGHEVVEAADAGVGLSAYREHPADVVFLNVLETGRMDVGEFVRQLRSQFADARVVAMATRTSYGTVDPLAVARQFGPVHTLRIPFSPADLLRAVTEARE